MRIAFVSTEFVTEEWYSGGLANYLHRVARALVMQGHEVHIVTYSVHPLGTLVHDGIVVHRVGNGALEQHLNRLTRYRVPHTAKWLDFSFQAYRKLRSIHQQTPLDCVQYPNYLVPGLFASLLLRVPYVLRISSFSPAWHRAANIERTPDIRMLERLERLQLRISRHIYAPSQALVDMIQHATGIDRIQVIRTPFALEVPSDQSDYSVYNHYLVGKRYLLYFGRFQPNKGFHILAQALPSVLEAHPDLTAVMVGRDMKDHRVPSYKAYAQELCRPFGEQALFLDALPHAQLYPIIAGARLVALPSLVDNLPNACLEAMALGKPVVGTRGASFEELIEDEVSGFLVPPGDPKALAEKVIVAWERKDLADIGRRASAVIDAFSLDQTIPPLVALYRMAMATQHDVRLPRMLRFMLH